MIALACSFFITAVLYACVGFGGGSTYNALLVIAEVDYRILPSIALICNLLVVSGGVWQFHRAGYVDFLRISPWVITSVPAAWLGGNLNISEELFVGLLGGALLASSMRMLWPSKKEKYISKNDDSSNWFIPLFVGMVIGFIAGLVGIGGGIFLAPILYLMRWDSEKKIAATCSVFILVNSVSGLAGQMAKISDISGVGDLLLNYWLLFSAVLVGGQIGSVISVKRLDPRVLNHITAFLILYVSLRLLWRWFNM